MAKKINYNETTCDAVSEDISAENDTENVENTLGEVENANENTAEISDSAVSREISENNTDNTAEKSGNVVSQTCIQTVVYIGPTIFRTDFVSSRVFRTHDKPLSEYYPDEYSKYPELSKLIVPLTQLGRAKSKLLSGGNSISAAYKSLLKKIGG